MLSTYCVCDS